MDVEDVIAHRNFHEFFILLEVPQAQFALSLVHHVNKVAWIVELIRFRVFESFVYDFVHDFEINTYNGFNSFQIFRVIIELAVSFVSTAENRSAYALLTCFLPVNEDETK